MKHKEITLACIIYTYNRANYIEQCVKSILMQKTKYVFSIIIADDCSSDNTKEVIDKIKKENSNFDIHYFSTPHNIGLGKLVLKNLRPQIEHLLNTDYIYRIDSDDYITDPNKFEKQISFLNQNPECIGICHHYKVLDERTDKEIIENKAVVGTYTAIELFDFIGGKSTYNHTSTYLYRNIHKFILPPEFDKMSVKGDVLYNAAMMRHGKVHFTDDVMSTYRLHDYGVWESMSIQEKNRANDRLVIDLFLMLSLKNKMVVIISLTIKFIRKMTTRLIRKLIAYKVSNKNKIKNHFK